MPNKNIKRWYQASETTSERQRSARIRAFKIESLLTSWEVVGERLKNKEIVFQLKGYSNYTFTLSNSLITGKKVAVKKVSDSGILTSDNGRFNLINDLGTRGTVRMGSLPQFLKEVFE